MRRFGLVILLVMAMASNAIAQLRYDSAKLVYTLESKKPVSHDIDQIGKLFDQALRAQTPVVLFIHGRGPEPQKSLLGGTGAAKGLAVKKLSDYGVNVLMYNWDSEAAAGDSKDRQRPLNNMPAAQERLGMVLDKLGQTLINLEHEHITPPPITLLAHSMGTIVVQRYVEAQDRWRTPGGRSLFTNVVLSSSDATHEGHALWVDKIAAVEPHVYVTINPIDFVLGQSRIAHPPNPHPLGREKPGDDRSQHATYVKISALNHEIFNTGDGRPFFKKIFAGEHPAGDF